MSTTICRFAGKAAEPFIDELARLRIEVFREFPYLYNGSTDYERTYLRTYLDVPESVIAIAFDDDRVVGASTGLPMSVETDEVKQPFIANGYDPEQIFYFGESVLEPKYRGRGLGVRFFVEREAHARSLGRFRLTAFCAVQRPEDHSRRPRDYQPLDEFWIKRGYRKHSELTTTFSWQDLDESSQSPKPMVFWIKHIT